MNSLFYLAALPLQLGKQLLYAFSAVLERGKQFHRFFLLCFLGGLFSGTLLWGLGNTFLHSTDCSTRTEAVLKLAGIDAQFSAEYSVLQENTYYVQKVHIYWTVFQYCFALLSYCLLPRLFIKQFPYHFSLQRLSCCIQFIN